MDNVLVIDACVVLKWRFRDENETEESIYLLSDALNGDVEIVTPTLWIYEITNALRTAVLRRRITKTKARSDLIHFLQVGVRLISPDEGRLKLILSDAISSQCSVYDISYIDLARQLGCNFYTGDRKLYDSIYNIFPFVRWIGDYKSSKAKK